MAAFTLIAQSLRTGEPMSQAFHRNLFDRLHYHGTVGARSLGPKRGNEERTPGLYPLEMVTTYHYMFYASAIMSVLQILDVSPTLCSTYEQALHLIRHTRLSENFTRPLSGFAERFQ